MARSFSNAKFLSGLIANSINKRGFAASAAGSTQGVVSSVAKAAGVARSSGMVKKTREKVVGPTDKVSWVPDPRTGFYRPENVAEEIDVAELRATLLKKH